MKIGVISDTHVDSVGKLPLKSLRLLEGVDLVIHLGDYTGEALLEGLRRRFRFKGVYGNNDPPRVKARLRREEVFEVAGFKVVATHPADIMNPIGVGKKLKRRFNNAHVILYGHTHLARLNFIDGALLLNPGSLTGKFPAMKKTMGVLYVEGTVKGKIVKI